jgi:hypothetical protein
MNRRKFLTRLASATAIALAAGATTVTLEGCTFNITDAINTVLNSALAILNVLEPNSSLYTQLKDAITALEQAEGTWQAGGASTIVVDALNTIEAVLAVVPVTAPYAPLIDILFAGIEAVMSAFGLTTQLSALSSAKRPTVVNSSHYNAAVLNPPSWRHPTWQGAYKAQWNNKANTIGLPKAEIH